MDLESICRIIGMDERGISRSKISKIFNRSEHWVSGLLGKETELCPWPNLFIERNNRKKFALLLYEQGVKTSKIARYLNVCQRTIERWFGPKNNINNVKVRFEIHG